MGSEKIEVRPAREADARAIAALLAAGSLTPGAEDPGSPDRYAAALVRVRASGGEVLVAQADGQVVGVCEVLILEHIQHGGARAAELESVHVDATRRSQGVGAALVAASVQFAQTQGCYRIQLTSNLARHDAHRFYEANGFSATHVGFKRALDAPR